MSDRKIVSARLSAILLAALLSATVSAPASAAVNVDITDFRGAWASTISYAPGAVVTYNGASYICLVGNTGLTPNTNTAHWGLLDAPGLQGATGPQGPQGVAGPAGPKGPEGPAGATGAQGPQGIPGPQGATGAKGATGAQGAIGPTGPSGAAGPSGSAATIEIGTVETSSPSLPALVSNGGTSSKAILNFSIPQGATGAQGPTGPMGPAGAGGAMGPAGPTGPIGPTGPTGPTGPAGANGTNGTNGTGIPNCTSPNTYLVFSQGALVCQPRFNVNGDGTLTDNSTGLMWELQTSNNFFCSADITCYNNTYTWSTGDNNPDGTLYTTFLATLNSDSTSGSSTCFANHCDWRIPNIVELQTIIEPGASECGGGSPCIDPAFGTTQADIFWSSSSLASNPSFVWTVDFYNISVGNNSKTDTHYARAVRSGR